MIETIIFDLGKVILDFDHHLITQRLSKISNRDEAELFDFIFTSGLERSFAEGKICPEDFFKEIIKELNISLNFNGFKSIWNDIFSPPEEEMIRLLNRLKERYRLYLLSNTNILHFEYVRDKYKVLEIFEEYILSYQIGVTKPDSRIYLEALKRSNTLPERVIYIDDIKEFAQAATKVGMKGIHFESIEGLKESLKEYHVLREG